MYDTVGTDGMQASPYVAMTLHQQMVAFLSPLLQTLDALLDKRLVRTVVRLVEAVIQFRHASYGLLLSELGGYVLSPAQAAAGTKRISNLLRSSKWSFFAIEHFLWRNADQRVRDLTAIAQDTLAVWDQSVVEKPESIAIEGLCAVRSTTAVRLKRIKPGYFNPPGGRPIFVPGLHWLALSVMGRSGPPTLAAMRWWTTRGKYATSKRDEEGSLLRICAQAWGEHVIHIWDRGFAGGQWLGEALTCHVRFVLRWPKHYMLVSADGVRRKAWEVARGKRNWGHRELWDARRRCWRKTGVVALPVWHSDFSDRPLWLVVSRPGHGRPPWYLLTNEPIGSEEEAWRVVLAYARRWQIEMTWRYGKSELAMESPRLWSWDNRVKLLLIVSLAYAFLLSALHPVLAGLRQWLLASWCHRTGKRSRETRAPLYRLRSAISRLWQTYPPPPLSFPLENSG